MSNFRNLALWAIILILLIAVFNMVGISSSRTSSNEVTYSQLLADIGAGSVQSVVINNGELVGKRSNGSDFIASVPLQDPQLLELLTSKGVDVKVQHAEESTLMNVFISWFPMLLLVAVWIFFMRNMGGGGAGKAMGFGKSKAKLLTEGSGTVTFEDVAGIDEAKEDLSEIVDFLKNPNKYTVLGGHIPRGALLVGPPGTGKTLLARAIAGEANVPFFSISGSDFVEMFVGVGASRVRDMFEQAKKNAPCIVFIDEIDAVGRHRGAGIGGGNDEREQTLNQLLVEMDGFADNEGVIIIAATNRPDVLDPALLRPGRFDRQIEVPNPDIIGREQILKVHLKKIKSGNDVEARHIARGTPGFSGADLANLCNEAALLAARRGKRVVTDQEFEDAKDKVMMGAERRTLVMSDDERRLTAFHEAGHALVAMYKPESDPVHKATIIPRGRALGLVMRLPERDAISHSREKFHADLAVAMAGRVAEEILVGYDKITSGAASDIQQATKMARGMVTQWGMSDKMGMVDYAGDPNQGFMGQPANSGKISEKTMQDIDIEVKRLVSEGYNEAKRILTENAKQLDILGNGLLEYETLTGSEIKRMIAGEDIGRENVVAQEKAGAATVPDTSSVPTSEDVPQTAKTSDDAAKDNAPKDDA
ncbi:MAG: ATP-dependent metallopeptidase FtsH/Yme1/Tma family protein [Rhizobiales bacterium]|nr:ATP-dependent metallopeptidase FtsH/Yme1/Tma family protein [Hyphomicrobiales bacterium]